MEESSIGDIISGNKGRSSASLRGSTSSPGLLSRLPFIRASHAMKMPPNADDEPHVTTSRGYAMASAMQHQTIKTRRRKGSLRKVALLGRGAQRERKDGSPLALDTSTSQISPAAPEAIDLTPKASRQYDALGLHAEDLTPRPSTEGYASRTSLASSSMSSASGRLTNEPREQSSTAYNSTTDEDEMIQLPRVSNSLHPNLPLAPTTDSYFGNMVPTQRRRSFQQEKSPLSYSGLPTAPLQAHDFNWDYSETEWWGWVVIVITWLVFVVGMGSCLGVWSWAWDVGKTPYAPPELEDDPTLPIVGYYPALIILTGVMAWVWVVVAWVGMKYFRHAKISGD